MIRNSYKSLLPKLDAFISNPLFFLCKKKSSIVPSIGSLFLYMSTRFYPFLLFLELLLYLFSVSLYPCLFLSPRPIFSISIPIFLPLLIHIHSAIGLPNLVNENTRHPITFQRNNKNTIIMS